MSATSPGPWDSPAVWKEITLNTGPAFSPDQPQAGPASGGEPHSTRQPTHEKTRPEAGSERPDR